MGTVIGPFVPPPRPARQPVEDAVVRMLEHAIVELKAGRRIFLTENMVEWIVDAEHGDSFKVSIRFKPMS